MTTTAPMVAARLLPGIDSAPRCSERGHDCARARREHFLGMRAVAVEIRGGLLVAFECSGEAWFWRSVGGGWFEEVERITEYRPAVAGGQQGA